MKSLGMRSGAGAIVVALAALFAGASAVAQPAADSSSVTANPNPVVVGQSVTLTATITGPSDPETIQFTESPGGIIGGCQQQPVTETGADQYQATCTTSFDQPGSETIEGQGTGAGGVEVTANPLTLTVEEAPTAVTVTASSTAPVVGADVTYTATVAFQYGGGATPGGDVEFLDGGAPIAGCQSEAAGERSPGGPVEAVCQTSYSAPGTHSITAAYPGGNGFAGSTSAPVTVTVGAVASGSLAACPGQDTPEARLALVAARAAVLCLLNEVRARYGEPAVSESAELDNWAQAHPLGGLPPSFKAIVSAALYANTVSTPYGLIAALMRTRFSCESVLLGDTVEGLGVTDRALIRAVPLPETVEEAQAPTWTVLLAETTNEQVGLGSVNSCPHPLPVDAARQGVAPQLQSILLFPNVYRAGHHIEATLGCKARHKGRHGCILTVRVTLPDAHATLPARRFVLPDGISTIALPVTVSALERELRAHVPVIQLAMHVLRPLATDYLYEARLARSKPR